MRSRKTIDLDLVYFDTRTQGEVTATVEAWWAPGKRLAFIDLQSWERDPKKAGKTGPVLDRTRPPGNDGVPFPLEPQIRVLREPTENEILRLAIQLGEEWYTRVGRASGQIPAPVVQGGQKRSAG